MDVAIEVMLQESKALALMHPKQSYQLAEEAYRLASEQSLQEEQAYAKFHMAYACRVMSEYSDGLSQALASLKMFETMNHSQGKIKASNIVGIIYFYYGDLTRSLRHFLDAMEGLNRDKNPLMEVSVVNNIGEVYREAGQLEDAVAWLLQGKAIAGENRMDNEWATVLTNLGELYHLQGKEAEAFYEFEQAYAKVIDSDNRLLQGELATKLGRSHRLRHDYEQARYLFNKANTCFSQIENKYYFVELLQNIADLEEDMANDPLPSMQEALAICQRLKLDKKMSALYLSFSEYYERIQDNAHALEYYKLYHLKEKEVEASYLSDRMEILVMEMEHDKDKDELQRLSSISKALQKDVELAKTEVNRLKERNDQLQKENGIDPLTRTYNRRGIHTMYEDLCKEYQERYAGLLMIDIDHFKKYNDQWGHIQGDICLSRIARVLISHQPEGGFVGRFGGEEFIVCFPTGDEKQVEVVAENIRQAIEKLQIIADKNSEDVVTVSIGGGRIAHNTCSIIEHIERVDRQLYRAKKDGRNRIAIEHTTVAESAI